MKMNRLICLALSFVLLLALPACTDQDVHGGTTGTTAPTDPLSDNNYEIFISRGSAERSYFAGAVSVNELYPEVTKPEPTEQTRTAQINGVSYELNYVRTYEAGMHEYAHIYETTDEKVSCIYWAGDMQISRAAINFDLAEFADMDQQQYEQWIQTFVSQFMQEDWSKLQMSCQTLYGGLAVDGFTTEVKEDKAPIEYRFSYDRYIDSVKTTDDISVDFTIKAEDGIMRVLVGFNRHEFDAIDTVEWDETTIEVVINECLSEYAAENIVLKSWEVSDTDELIMIDGNIMLSRTIDVAYTWKGLPYDATYDLIIDIPDP